MALWQTVLAEHPQAPQLDEKETGCHLECDESCRIFEILCVWRRAAKWSGALAVKVASLFALKTQQFFHYLGNLVRFKNI